MKLQARAASLAAIKPHHFRDRRVRFAHAFHQGRAHQAAGGDLIATPGRLSECAHGFRGGLPGARRVRLDGAGCAGGPAAGDYGAARGRAGKGTEIT